jgi:hypothetical protein
VLAWAVLAVVVAVVTLAVIVDACSPSTSLDGVPGITVRPETALDRQCCGPGPLSAILMLRRGGFG